MKRGKPFQPGNLFGRGRPRGSRNKKSMIQELLDEHELALVRKAVLLALQGDRRCLQMLVGHVLPRPKDAPIKTARLRMTTPEDLLQSVDQLSEDLAAGKITAPQARVLISLIRQVLPVIESHSLEQRLREIEKYLGKGNEQAPSIGNGFKK
jgi:aryl-alcohol dehydrogenase-like predicted oxidoreductase